MKHRLFPDFFRLFSTKYDYETCILKIPLYNIKVKIFIINKQTR